MISTIAMGGALLAWRLWFVNGGWNRHQHWLEGLLWGACILLGLWGAISAMFFYPGRLVVKMTGAVLFILHAFSSLLFGYFFVWLKYGAGTVPP